MNNFYITTPIYYVNDIPHIGHAYTNLVCDVIARFMKLSGKKVNFITGTDEHGLKIEKAAKKLKLAPQEFVDKISVNFNIMNKKLFISNNDFIRTTEQKHKEAVQYFWQKLYKSGNIYLGEYEGWYSIQDEAYYNISELNNKGLAPTGAKVELIKEPSYFFALSKWQNKLLEYYDNNPNFILPKNRKHEIINFVKSGLNDLSISRTSFKWGITVPGNNNHIIYVWLDALVNYLSILGYPKLGYQKFWPASIHVIGKDILRFHAIFWPAFLMAAGLELPKSILAHGWWLNDGEKMSKSKGNVINPIELVDQFGLDQVRYYLIREISLGNDGNYSPKTLLLRNNSELSNKIGNLIQRTLTFIYNHYNGVISNITNNFIDDIYYLSEASKIFNYIQSIIQKNTIIINNSYNINNILENIINISEKSNIYINQQAPWIIKNQNQDLTKKIIYSITEMIRYIGIMLQPFIPNSANTILNSIGVDVNHRQFKHLTKQYALKSIKIINKPIPIFPRIKL